MLPNVLGELDRILCVREAGVHRRHHRRVVPAAVLGESVKDGASEGRGRGEEGLSTEEGTANGNREEISLHVVFPLH